MIRNFGAIVKTGRLKGRQKTLEGLERFAAEEPRGVILKHIVERIILDPSLSPATITKALAEIARDPLAAFDSLNPGYRMKATIEVGNKKLVGYFDSLIEDKAKQSLTIGGGNFDLLDIDKVRVDLAVESAY